MLVCLMGSVLSCLKNSQSINNSSLFWEEFFFFFFFPVDTCEWKYCIFRFLFQNTK